MSEMETPSMKDFEEEINRSMKKMQEGDILTGMVIGVTDTEVMVDLGSYTEGIIRLEELSNDPRFSIKADIAVGDQVKAVVLREDDGKGSILLSKKQADDILAWDRLKELLESKEAVTVKLPVCSQWRHGYLSGRHSCLYTGISAGFKLCRGSGKLGRKDIGRSSYYRR